MTGRFTCSPLSFLNVPNKLRTELLLIIMFPADDASSGVEHTGALIPFSSCCLCVFQNGRSETVSVSHVLTVNHMSLSVLSVFAALYRRLLCGSNMWLSVECCVHL